MSKSHDFITNREKLAPTSQKSYFDIQALTRSRSRFNPLRKIDLSQLRFSAQVDFSIAVPKYFPKKVW